MLSVRWHGRGGQGAFTAAKLLGAAYTLDSGAYALAFPSFGPERRGAPVRAFTKLDTKPVADRSEIKTCDYIVILDDTLYDPTFLTELHDGGRVIVNSKRDFGDERVLSLDAQGIAQEELGSPMTNTAMLGALLGVWGKLTEEQALEAVAGCLSPKIAHKNRGVILRSIAAAKTAKEGARV